MSLALCLQVMSQAPQHVRRTSHLWWLHFLPISRLSQFHSFWHVRGRTPTGVFKGGCRPLTYSSLGFPSKTAHTSPSYCLSLPLINRAVATVCLNRSQDISQSTSKIREQKSISARSPTWLQAFSLARERAAGFLPRRRRYISAGLNMDYNQCNSANGLPSGLVMSGRSINRCSSSNRQQWSVSE